MRPLYILPKNLLLHLPSRKFSAPFLVACIALSGCDTHTQQSTSVTPVRITTAQLENGYTSSTLSGTIVPRVESQLAFRVPGRIIERLVDTGSNVTKGDILARLDNSPFKLAVQETKADLAQAQATAARTQRDVNRNRQLVQNGAIAGADFDVLVTQNINAQAQVRATQSRLERAEIELGYTQLRAPNDGTIALVQAEPGQVIQPGTPVLRLAATGESEIQTDVPESLIRLIALQQPTHVQLLSIPEIELNGIVREIASVADPVTRTYRVRVALHDLPEQARLGMTASVRFNKANNQKHITLPITALFQQKDQPAVWVLPAEADQLELRPIDLAAMDADSITVANGLSQGERVVVAGVHRLDANMSVEPWDGRLP